MKVDDSSITQTAHRRRISSNLSINEFYSAICRANDLIEIDSFANIIPGTAGWSRVRANDLQKSWRITNWANRMPASEPTKAPSTNIIKLVEGVISNIVVKLFEESNRVTMIDVGTPLALLYEIGS